MTLHQAAQKAVEALTDILGIEVMAPEGGREEVQEIHCIARAALASLESALQQQPEPVALADVFLAFERAAQEIVNKDHSDLVVDWLARAWHHKVLPALQQPSEAAKWERERTGCPALQEVPREPAPPNSLPTWGECALRVGNSEYIAKRVAEGGYGAEPDTLLATELHRFIHEYDDADPYRSAWFLHRLELLLNEVRSAPPSTTHQQEAGSPVVVLNDEQWAHFMETMSNPDEPTEALKRGARLLDELRAQRAATAPSTPESAEKDDAGGGKESQR